VIWTVKKSVDPQTCGAIIELRRILTCDARETVADSPDIADIDRALAGLAAQLEQALPEDAPGVGIDHIPIGRIGEHVPVEALLTRIATPTEHRTWFDDCEPAHRRRRAARLFCLKESCAKAMGLGFGAELDWSDLDVQSLEADAFFPVRCHTAGTWSLVAGHAVVEDVVVAIAGAGG
jgi:holo-[acyl-carrier-protein] synthase